MSLHAEGLCARYGRGPLVLDGVDIDLHPGETLGVTGPSGSGKSTLARVLTLLHPAHRGSFSIDGRPVARWRHAASRDLRRRFGYLYQAPRAAVDPRYRLRAVIAEPLRLAGRRRGESAAVDRLAALTGLTPDLLERRPHQVSDGQLQRACLARAIALDPGYLVCDEITAMLDASTTAHLVRTIAEWQRNSGAAVLAVSHDTVLLDRWADRTLALSDGRPAPGGQECTKVRPPFA